MTIDMFFQSVINGTTLSMIYILVALGLTLIYSIMHIPNFAHGELFMIGAFVGFFAKVQWGLNYFLAILIAMVVVAALGVTIEKTILKRLRGKFGASLIATLGLISILNSSSYLVFGTTPKTIPTVFKGLITVGNVTFPLERMVVVFIAIILVVALTLFIKYVKIGKAMRACEQDPEAAQLQGISVDTVSTVCMIIGSGLAAAAGVLIAPLFYIQPTIGMDFLFKGFIVIVIGGLGSVPGALVGGLIVGFIDAFTTVLLGAQIGYGVSFFLLIVVLLLRPKGIFGYEVQDART